MLYSQKIIDDKVGELKRKYNVTVQQCTSRKTGAVLFRYKETYHIYLSDALPQSIYPIMVLHEIAHIITHTIGPEYEKNKKAYVERMMNFIAICLVHRAFRFTDLVYLCVLALSGKDKALYNEFVKGEIC